MPHRSGHPCEGDSIILRFCGKGLGEKFLFLPRTEKGESLRPLRSGKGDFWLL